MATERELLILRLLRKFASHRPDCACFVCRTLDGDERALLAELVGTEERLRIVTDRGKRIGECRITPKGRWRAYSSFLVIGGTRDLGLHPTPDAAAEAVRRHAEEVGTRRD